MVRKSREKAAVREVETVIFDMGGVLLDFDHTRAWKALAKEAKVPWEEIRDYVTGEDLIRRHDRGEIGPKDFHQRLARRFFPRFPYEPFRKAWSEIFTEKPEVTELLFLLDGVLPLFLLSNTDPIHFEYIRRTYPFMQLFEGEILSYEVGACKPDEAIYRAALKAAGAPAASVLFFDDLLPNVEGARRVGIRAHHFAEARELKKSLVNHGLLTDE